ncbi:MAG: aminotransferase class I/II-fold pyridoxal phosphate-dependent enzyme [Acidobacteriota bacterium]|nr:aminotransferase class I/II-fold pyridoxal phosphate-dependent enzyme [Acidobacteriota bacterium]
MVDENRLSLSTEEMRRLGYRVIDLLVEHHASLSRQRVSDVPDRAEIRARLSRGVPDEGRPPEEVFEEAFGEVFSAMAHLQHPRFFAFVPSPSNFVGVLADALAAGMNPFLGSWAVASGPAQIELNVIEWLRGVCGLPETAGGLFVSGGSMANLTALAAARRLRLADKTEGATIYCSDQTHSSIDRALRVLGFAEDQLRKLATDDQFRLDLSSLRNAVADDRQSGRRPFCVVANAGTTNTGAVDPLVQLSDFCRGQNLWLHVDGAYGAPAMLTEKGRAALGGIGYADSLSLDPHKWLFQPMETGCVLLRDRRDLLRTFHVLPEYLRDVKGGEEETNFRDYGIQLTRSFRALKLWLSLQVFGESGFRNAVRRGIELAELAESQVREREGWEIVSPAQLGIVAFRYAPPSLDDAARDRLNRALVDALKRGGFAMISSTELRGRTALRLCTINPRTTDEDIRATVGRLCELADELHARDAA